MCAIIALNGNGSSIKLLSSLACASSLLHKLIKSSLCDKVHLAGWAVGLHYTEVLEDCASNRRRLPSIENRAKKCKCRLRKIFMF